ncbi:6242_t:CDS:2 [Acaulospora colombiana]|uniref:6242_t:CDS:1 n=1 Tax=Acaulospora colombiana TaxID=27376 RepID=A0ACA9KE30_9GLOM|nr:6242_t:CDS:2 [Acaulospora colombiana]
MPLFFKNNNPFLINPSVFHKFPVSYHRISHAFFTANLSPNHHLSRSLGVPRTSNRPKTSLHSYNISDAPPSSYPRYNFPRSTRWNVVVPHRSYVGRAQTTVGGLIKNNKNYRIFLSPTNAKNAVERIRQKKIRLERIEAKRRKKEASMEKNNTVSLAQRLKVRLQGGDLITSAILANDTIQNRENTIASITKKSEISSNAIRRKSRATVNELDRGSSSCYDNTASKSELHGEEKDVKITLESLLRENLDGNSKSVGARNKYDGKLDAKIDARKVERADTRNVKRIYAESADVSSQENNANANVNQDNHVENSNSSRESGEKQGPALHKYNYQILSQQILQRSSRLSKRRFLLELINKRALPQEHKQPRDMRIKEIDRENLFAGVNSLPRNYDPNWKTKPLPGWLKHKYSIMERTGFEKWEPKKKVSREIMDEIRTLHEQAPEENTPKILSQQFKISPEAVRRILRSKWTPDPKRLERQKQKLEEKLSKLKAERKLKRKMAKEFKKLKKKKSELYDETRYLANSMSPKKKKPPRLVKKVDG